MFLKCRRKHQQKAVSSSGFRTLLDDHRADNVGVLRSRFQADARDTVKVVGYLFDTTPTIETRRRGMFLKC